MSRWPKGLQPDRIFQEATTFDLGPGHDKRDGGATVFGAVLQCSAVLKNAVVVSLCVLKANIATGGAARDLGRKKRISLRNEPEGEP